MFCVQSSAFEFNVPGSTFNDCAYGFQGFVFKVEGDFEGSEV